LDIDAHNVAARDTMLGWLECRTCRVDGAKRLIDWLELRGVRPPRLRVVRRSRPDLDNQTIELAEVSGQALYRGQWEFSEYVPPDDGRVARFESRRGDRSCPPTTVRIRKGAETGSYRLEFEAIGRIHGDWPRVVFGASLELDMDHAGARETQVVNITNSTLYKGQIGLGGSSAAGDAPTEVLYVPRRLLGFEELDFRLYSINLHGRHLAKVIVAKTVMIGRRPEGESAHREARCHLDEFSSHECSRRGNRRVSRNLLKLRIDARAGTAAVILSPGSDGGTWDSMIDAPPKDSQWRIGAGCSARIRLLQGPSIEISTHRLGDLAPMVRVEDIECPQGAVLVTHPMLHARAELPVPGISESAGAATVTWWPNIQQLRLEHAPPGMTIRMEQA
jgi:hypothetical protein